MVNVLTKEQTKLIISMWKKDDFDWLYAIGMAIYDRIFELAPTAKYLFPYVVQAEKEGKDMRECTGFKRQALRFVQALSGILSAIDDTSVADVMEVKRRLRSIGYRHRAFKAQNRFEPKMWRVFERALIHVMEKEFNECCTLNEHQKRVSIAGWRIVANFIITQMEIGFYSDSLTKTVTKVDVVDSTGCCHF